MINIRKMSPMVRSIGTMGVVAGLVGAVTFANLQSNVVALDPNTLDSATASLEIGSNAEAFTHTSVTGINATLVPGIPQSFTFYLKNDGQSDMNVTASVPTNVSGSPVPASDISLSFDCGSGPVTFTLAAWSGGSAAIPGNPLTAGNTWTCSETATLSSSYSGSGGQAVTPFRVEFVGNQ